MPKKPSKGDKEQAAAVAAEANKERQRVMKSLLEEIRAEEYNEERAASVEIEEAALRDEQLQKTQEILRGHYELYEENLRIAAEEENWRRYMTCDGLPDPEKPWDMNTFMYLWRSANEDNVTFSMVSDKCNVVISLLTKLGEVVRSSTAISRERVAEYEVVAREFKEQLQRWIDMACYRLLRHIETDMNKVDLKTARYTHVSDLIVCCLWTPVDLPVEQKTPTQKDRKPVEVQFDELEISVRLPNDMDCYRMAIRALWLGYDHYSDDAASRVMPHVPEEYHWEPDFAEFCRKEHETRLAIREEQTEGRRLRLQSKRTMLERMEHPTTSAAADKKGKQVKKAGGKKGKKEPEPVPEPEVVELPYLPTIDEILLQREDQAKEELRKILFARCEKNEVNLRKYSILGGIYRVDLIYQPPQPKDTGLGIELTTLETPKEPRFVPFSRAYEAPPPAPDHERTPEVIEAEMKALEAAMEALFLVTLKLPSTVLWFEPPLVAHWIPETRMWLTKDIHDIKFNDEKQTIVFRTGRLGVLGLAARKFANLPFQSWELKPEVGRNAQGGVVLSIAGATVQAEFIVREDTACLNSLIGSTSPSLKAMQGDYMKLHHLIEKLRKAGCDFFPEQDASAYVKGLTMKHPVMERHLRHCMSLLSTSYTFAWSRWNAGRTLREIVLQFKELHGCLAKERTNLTLLVTPSRTMAVGCTEVSSEFSDAPLDGEDAKFYADLYHLAIHEAGIKSRLLMKEVSFKQVVTVAQLLERTNVISMSS